MLRILRRIIPKRPTSEPSGPQTLASTLTGVAGSPSTSGAALSLALKPEAIGYALLGLSATAVFVSWSCWLSRTAYLDEFAANAHERAEQIKALYLIELTRQQGAGALFASSRLVDAAAFRRFVRETESGTTTARLSIAFLQPVPRRERRVFEAGLRRDYGAQQAHITPSAASARGAPATAHPPDSALAMRFVEPVVTPLSRPGLDLSSEAAIDKAAGLARQTGRTAFSAIQSPVDGDSHTAAFRLITPVFSSDRISGAPGSGNHRPLGFICGTYRYRDLLEAVLSRVSHLGQHVYAYDSYDPQSRPVYLHRSRQDADLAVDEDLSVAELARFPHRVDEHVTLADRDFLLAFVPIRPASLWAFLDHRSRMMALGGALVSALLAYLGQRIGTARVQRKAADARLRMSATVFHDAQEGIMITEADGSIIEVNDTFSEITGYSRDEVLGKNPRILKSGLHDGPFYQDLWQKLTNEGVWRGEIWNRRRSGELYAVQATLSAVRDEQGRITHLIDLFSDITDRKSQQERIEHLAYFDALTDLPNRTLLLDRLEQALARGRRDGSAVCVAYLDLDDFKPVNDTHGHKAGDLLLCEIARRLQASVREHDSVCRLGGDEFVILLSSLHNWEECEKILSRALENISRPYALPNGMSAVVSGSIGVTLSPPDRATADSLLRHADQAMYRAKRAGRNRIQRFAVLAPGGAAAVPVKI